MTAWFAVTLPLGLDVIARRSRGRARVFCRRGVRQASGGATADCVSASFRRTSDDNEQRRRVTARPYDAPACARCSSTGRRFRRGPKQPETGEAGPDPPGSAPAHRGRRSLAGLVDAADRLLPAGSWRCDAGCRPGRGPARSLAGECGGWSRARLQGGQNVYVKGAIEHCGQAPCGVGQERGSGDRGDGPAPGFA